MRQKWTQIKPGGYDLGLASKESKKVSGRRAAATKSARKQYNLKIKICEKHATAN